MITKHPKSSVQIALKRCVLSMLTILLLSRSFFWLTADCPEEQSHQSTFRNRKCPPGRATDRPNQSLRFKAPHTTQTTGADLPSAETSASMSGNIMPESSSGGLGSDNPLTRDTHPAQVEKPSWDDIWKNIITDERCVGVDTLGTKLPQVPPLGIDWPSKSIYDNKRGKCAFKGAIPYKILTETLLNQCADKLQSFSNPLWPSCPPLLNQSLFKEREKAFVSPDGHSKNKILRPVRKAMSNEQGNVGRQLHSIIGMCNSVCCSRHAAWRQNS